MIRGNKVDPDPRVEKEVNSLIKDGRHSVVIVAWDKTAKYGERIDTLRLKNGDVKIVRFGIPAVWGGGMRKNAIPAYCFQRKVSKWLRKHRDEYDCIHATSFNIGKKALKYQKQGKKLVYDVYDYYADIHKTNRLIHNLIKKVEDRVINFADATIICSEARKEQIRGTHPKQLYVIHNSPSQDELAIDDSVKISKSNCVLPKVVYVGNLIEDRYIRSLLEISSKTNLFELHIGGFGVLEKMAKEYSEMYENIYFYGKLKYSDVLKLEKESDIMVALYDPSIPNHKYAAPNKFYEALFLGKPIIMFKNTGMDTVISSNGIGEVCDFDKESLFTAINNLISKKQNWNSIKEKEKELYENLYSWEIMAKRLLELYEKI